MTVVADLLATIRGDSSNFQQSLNQAEDATKKLVEDVEGASESISRMKDAAGIAATAVGGTFTAGLVAAADITKHYTAEIESLRVSFTGLLGSAGAAENQIQKLEAMSATLGVNTGSLAGASRELSIYTQNQVDASAALSTFNDIAAGTGKNVQDVASAIGQAYAVMEREGPQSGSRMAQTLLRSGIITAPIADELTKEAQQAAPMSDVWKTLTQQQDRFVGSGENAAHTLRGVTASFHALLDQNIGQIFAPLVQGTEELISSLNTLMQSNGFKAITEEMGRGIESIASHMTGLTQAVTSFGASITTTGLQNFVSDMKGASVEIGAMIGLLTEFGAEFVGQLPIIRRFSEPFIAFLDQGRGGILAMLLVTKQGREAIMEFAGSVIHLIEAFSMGNGPVNTFLSAIASIAAKVIQTSAAIIEFIATNRTLISIIEGVVAAIATLVIIDTIIKKAYEMGEAFTKGVKAITDWMTTYGQKRIAQEDDITRTNAQITSTQALTAALRELQMALTGVAEAQGVAAGSAGLTTASQGAKLAELDAQLAKSGFSGLNKFGSEGLSMSGVGLLGGAGLAGGALMAGGSMVGGTGGGIMSALGMGLSGAAMGGVLGNAPGAIVGGVAGLAIGFTELAMHAHHAADELSKIRAAKGDAVESFDKNHPENLTNYQDILDRAAAAKSRITGDNGPSVTSDLLNANRDKVQLQKEYDDKKSYLRGIDAQGTPLDPAFIQEQKRELSELSMRLEEAKHHITALNGEAAAMGQISEKAGKDATAAQINVQTAMRDTGKTMDQVAQTAQALGVNLNFDTSTRSGRESMERLVAALKQIPTPLQDIEQQARKTVDALIVNQQQANNVATAIIALSDAQRNLAKVQATDFQLPVLQAQNSLERSYLAQQKAQYSLIDAQRAYNDSQLGSIGLTIKYSEAVLSVKDAQLAQQDASTSLLAAETNLARARQFGAGALTIAQDESAVAHAQLGQQSSALSVTKATHNMQYLSEDIASGKLEGEALLTLKGSILDIQSSSLSARAAQQQLTFAQLDASGAGDKLKTAEIGVSNATLGVVNANLQLIQGLSDLPGTIANVVAALNSAGMGDSPLVRQLKDALAVTQQIIEQQANVDLGQFQKMMDIVNQNGGVGSADTFMVVNAMHARDALQADITQLGSFNPAAANTMQSQLDAAHLADGGWVTSKGLSWVGEKGVELMLPLYDSARTMALLQSAGLTGALAGGSSNGAKVTMGGPSFTPVSQGSSTTVLNNFSVMIDHVENFEDFMDKMNALARANGNTSTTAPLNGAAYGRV